MLVVVVVVWLMLAWLLLVVVWLMFVAVG